MHLIAVHRSGLVGHDRCGGNLHFQSDFSGGFYVTGVWADSSFDGSIGPFIADFYCDSAKLVIELDGLTHVGAGMKDDQRTDFMRSHGLRVIRFTNDEVIADSVLVAEAIARAAGVPA
jgi:hypothetical protein